MTISALHRSLRESLPPVPCICGCGTMLKAFTTNGKPARLAQGHSEGGKKTRFQKGHVPSWTTDPDQRGNVIKRIQETHRGKKLNPEQIAQRTATRLERNGGVYQIARGWHHSESTREKFREASLRNGAARIGSTASPALKEKLRDAQRRVARYGPDNAAYGRRHTKESLEKMSIAKSGPNHHNWQGGVGALPYGPEFTSRFKKLIRDRDGNACRRCGKTKAENGKSKRTLDIHHLDHNKQNNDPSNLVTSCCGCNVWASFHRDEPFLPAI